MTGVWEHHRRHPVPFTLLCAGAALIIGAGVALYLGRDLYWEVFFWPGLLLVFIANVLLALGARRELQRR